MDHECVERVCRNALGLQTSRLGRAFQSEAVGHTEAVRREVLRGESGQRRHRLLPLIHSLARSLALTLSFSVLC